MRLWGVERVDRETERAAERGRAKKVGKGT